MDSGTKAVRTWDVLLRSNLKAYIAHPISNTYEAEASRQVADDVLKCGVSEVYAPALNKGINDKSNQPTPFDIYNNNVGELRLSQILIVNITGGMQDGTISEIGMVAGMNETWAEEFAWDRCITVFPYTTNQRLLQPQVHEGSPSASCNHMVLGAALTFAPYDRLLSYEEMLEELEDFING